MIRVINLKQPSPNADWAVYTLEQEITSAQIEGVGVIIFIHGYGAGGTGGVIKQAVQKNWNS